MATDPIPLTAPEDPRASWDLPPFGALPVVTTLGELATRVLAPNPSPMTLDGTNTYVLGLAGSGSAVIVDPGPDDPDHLARTRAVLSAADREVDLVLVTHHHVDHAEAASTWAAAFGAPVAAADPRVAGAGGRVLVDGDRLHLGGLDLEVVATPGHTRDHLAVRLPSGALLTGDHVLGRGTSVVAHPDGDLAAYLASLRRVADLGAAALYPGHGPALTQDPGAVLRYYAEHRAFRQAQVLDILARGPATIDVLVAEIYAEVDRRLWGAAAASTRAAVAVLVADGRAREHTDAAVVLLDGPTAVRGR